MNIEETITLLLVEDDRIDQRALLRVIEREKLPYQCETVETVAQAGALLNARHFDVVLTDYKLGDGDAFDIIRIAHNTPVIFITGLGSEELAVRAMKAGAYDYLTKDTAQHYLKLLPIVVNNCMKRRRAELEAQEMAQERVRREALEGFLRDVSHDLRTPLASLGTGLYVINRYAERLFTGLAETPNLPPAMLDQVTRLRERTSQMEDDRGRLEQIISDMLEMVKADNQTALHKVRYDLNALAQEVVDGYLNVAAENQQTLRFNPAPTAVYAPVAIGELSIVLEKLLDNALDYTPPGGEISVLVNDSGAAAEVTIADTGIGIPDEERENIFQRFYRIDKARSRKNGGSGLGLSIARRWVELHGGTIKVDSVQGQGSSFQVQLPLVEN
ncbi:MAG: hybrid sensor histidine kinase/response regulator [bacterium]|nr:hybrid sensor histidine kinase/response regulator [bacterium]